MSRAAQTHLAGHMRPAGRVFETPAIGGGIFSLTLSDFNESISEKI